MAVSQGPFLAAVLLLVSSGLSCSSSSAACPQSCTCQRASVLNCSSSGFSSVPQHIQDSVTELDLSHNLLDSVTLHRPYGSLRSIWLGNNSITHLSLCIERKFEGHNLREGPRLGPRSRRRCVSWAPNLQLLSAERNQLTHLPEGLESMDSLRVLQLSFNRISTLQPGELRHLQQLKELNLQHNLITSLHPQMFQDLIRLRVLDLSFNMLTSIHPLMYLNLRNIGADVMLTGNRWQCDCSMRSLRRRMVYDSSLGLQAWKMACVSPATLSGRELIQLEEDDLNCFSTDNGPDLHQDVTIYSGSEILLTCSKQDSVWWTSDGQASVNPTQAGLFISDIAEKDTGLYVCMSEEQQAVSVYNLQISKIGGARRRPRSVPRASQQIIPQGTLSKLGEERNLRAAQCDLVLAVCLSVFITFLVAFILGVLARPCIDVLWRRATKKKSSSATNSVSSDEQRQYDNEAYFDSEEPGELGAHRERRVTFTAVDFEEDNNVDYYDTVASGGQQSIDNHSGIEIETAEKNKHTAGDSGSEKYEYDHIPDPAELEERRSLSSSSDSSVSENTFEVGQMTQRGHKTPQSPMLVEDSIQQTADVSKPRKVGVPQITIDSNSDSNSESNSRNPTDPDLKQENEELFEFSDSVQSPSARSSSVFGSFNLPKRTVAPTSDKQRDDTSSSSSSSSSYISDDEPTKYIVNPYQDTKQEASFEQQNQNVDPRRPWPNRRANHSSSSDSSDSDEELVLPTTKQETQPRVTADRDIGEKIKPMPRTKWRSVNLGVDDHSKSLDTPVPSPRKIYSSSSSESEAEITDIKVEHSKGRVGQIKKHSDINAPLPDSSSSSSDETMKHKHKQGDVHLSSPPTVVPRTVSRNPETQWPTMDLEHTTSIKRSQDIKAPSSASDSSSSSDSEDDTTINIKKQGQGDVHLSRPTVKVSQTVSHGPGTQWPAVDLQHIPHIKRRLDVKIRSQASDSSSSRDSEDKTIRYVKTQEHMSRLPVKVSPTTSRNPETQWPTMDLEHTTSIKRRQDIKAPSSASDSSSSSDSEDETTMHIKTQGQGDVHLSRLPVKVSQTVSYGPGTQWPAVDLQHIPHIKRRLDVKIRSQASDSSSSRDSEDKTIRYVKTQEHMSRLPVKVSPTTSRNPETRWPTMDLEHTTSIKRSQDIKAPSSASDSSSSSDSEDEATMHIKTQGQGDVHLSRLPVKVSQTVSHGPGTQWPAVDLQHIPHIKRRLDVKIRSQASDSSSSRDSEDKTIRYVKTQEHMSRLPVKVSPTTSLNPETRWPTMDLEHTTSIKRSQDIKAPSSASDSSSSSDSEDEATMHIKTQGQGDVHLSRLPVKVSQTVSHGPGTQWPAVDLQHIPHIKRRLDVKIRSQASDSSSSRDSEDKSIRYVKTQEHMSRLPVKVSPTTSRNPETQWPTMDLEHTTSIKRTQDIKAPSSASDSSSSSDSEDETTMHIKTQGQGDVHLSRLPVKVSQTVSYGPGTQWPAVDLQHIPHIKRRLDVKIRSQASDSSSSRDSEDKTIRYLKTQEHMSRLPVKVSPTTSRNPETQWPTMDLEHTTSIKRSQDIKSPSSASDSSSSSDSEDDKTMHTKTQGQVDVHLSRLPVEVPQTVSHGPGTQWPAVDLQRIPHIKRRLDIKIRSQASDSSSSRDSEDKTIRYVKTQEHMSRLPVKVSPTTSRNPETQWPTMDLEHTTSIKRRQDIKAPSSASDSSSSSDSEDETTMHIKTQGQGDVHLSRLPVKVSQTVSHGPGTKWPAVDLQHIPHIKRRLDVKVRSQASDSSSSSDSEDETKRYVKTQEHVSKPPVKVSPTTSRNPETQWPTMDLEHTTSIKRSKDIKAPSSASDSSSSSDSEDEATMHIKTQGQGDVHLSRPPVKLSQTVSHGPGTQLSAVDLQHIPHIKRRLDVKVRSQASDSSSSSDSEDETKRYVKTQEHVSRLPVKVSPTTSRNPETQWPTMDLEHTTSIKRSQDIKAPTSASDSSSSSDSEDEATMRVKTQGQGDVHLSRPPVKVSPTVSHRPRTQLSAVDLQNIPHIKRRLDVKVRSQASDSSSSSDSEDETKRYVKTQEHVSKPPVKVSPTTSRNPETQWPTMDLEHTTSIKRSQDIKAPSSASDSSSSSDSEDEATMHIKTQGQGDVHLSRPPVKVSQTASHGPGTQLSVVDLQHTPHIKRRLDVKIRSQASDSSSSSDSEDETKRYVKTQEHVSRLPVKVSPTTSRNPKTQWPTMDLEHTTSIKRSQDIKAPSSASDSSSSSDSEDEATMRVKTQGQGDVHLSRPPVKVSQTVSHGPRTQLSAVDLQHIPHIKRRLDVKVRSQASDSSSSSDSEDKTIRYVKTQEHMSRLPVKVSPTTSLNPETQWPTMDLEHTTSIKRSQDIKAPSSASDSSSSSDSEDEATMRIKTQGQGDVHLSRPPVKVSQTVSHGPGKKVHRISPSSSSSSSDEQEDNIEVLRNPPLTVEPHADVGWPAVNLSSVLHVERRLDVKAPLPESSSSSDESERGTTLDKRNPDIQHINRRLDNKAPSWQPDLGRASLGSRQSESNSSTSDSEDENEDHKDKIGMGSPVMSKASVKKFIQSPNVPVINIPHSPKTEQNIKLEKYTVLSDDLKNKPKTDNIHEEINPELQSRWATMNLGISRFRKRLDISSHTHEAPDGPSSPPPKSPISESPTGSKSSTTRLKSRGVGVDYSLPRYNTVSEKAPDSPSDSSSSSNSEDEIDHRVPDLSLGVPRLKRRLDIKAPTPEPNNYPSSCSNSDNDVTEHTTTKSRHAAHMSRITDYDSPITYKRLIIKASSTPESYVSPSSRIVAQEHEGEQSASLSSKRVHSMGLVDKIKRKIGQDTVDLPPEIKWTGHLSDPSVSTPRSFNAAQSSQLPKHTALLLPKPYSSNSASSKSDVKIKQDSRTSDMAVLHGKYSSLNASRGVSLDNSPGSTYKISQLVSEDRKERKGLGAIKAMSTKRQQWDTEDLHASASPSFDHRGLQDDKDFHYHRSEPNITPMSKLPSAQLRISSASVEKRGATDFLYGIPSYRRHDVRNIEPHQAAPPPIPVTPLPDEEVGFTWRSLQSSKKQEWEDNKSFQQQSRHTKESDPSSLTAENLTLYFDSSNVITDV